MVNWFLQQKTDSTNQTIYADQNPEKQKFEPNVLSGCQID